MAEVQENFFDTKQIRETRKKIQDSFKRSHEALRVRENNLLSRVEEIETEFNKKTQEVNEMLLALNQMKSHNSDVLTSNILYDAREGVNTVLDQQVAKLAKELDYTLNFEWDSEWENKLKQLGTINFRTHPNISNPIPHTQIKPVTTYISGTPAPSIFNPPIKRRKLLSTTQPKSSNFGRTATGTSLFNHKPQKLPSSNLFTKTTPTAPFQFTPNSQTPLFSSGGNFQFALSPNTTPAAGAPFPFFGGQPPQPNTPTTPQAPGYNFNVGSNASPDMKGQIFKTAKRRLR